MYGLVITYNIWITVWQIVSLQCKKCYLLPGMQACDRLYQWPPYMFLTALRWWTSDPPLLLVKVWPTRTVILARRQDPLGEALPWQQGSWCQRGAYLGPTGPRWAPCWPHELCYLGSHDSSQSSSDGGAIIIQPIIWWFWNTAEFSRPIYNVSQGWGLLNQFLPFR